MAGRREREEAWTVDVVERLIRGGEYHDWVLLALGAENVQTAVREARRLAAGQATEPDPRPRMVGAALGLRVLDLFEHLQGDDRIRVAATDAFHVLRAVHRPGDADELMRLVCFAVLAKSTGEISERLAARGMRGPWSGAWDGGAWATCIEQWVATADPDVGGDTPAWLALSNRLLLQAAAALRPGATEGGGSPDVQAAYHLMLLAERAARVGGLAEREYTLILLRRVVDPARHRVAAFLARQALLHPWEMGPGG